VGRACQLIGQLRAAHEHYSRCLAESKSEEQKAAVTGFLDEVAKQAAYLTVEVQPPEAVVELDGDTAMCSVGKKCLLDPREYIVKVSADGYATVLRKVKLGPGDVHVESVSLAPDRAVLSVRSDVPGALVMLDGGLLGRTPLERDDQLEGSHSLRVEMDGRVPQERLVELKKGQRTELQVDMPIVERAPEITRSSVVWRAVAFPGLGHYHAGNETLGRVFMISESMCLAAALGSLGAMYYYEGQKEGETDPVTWGDLDDMSATAMWVSIGAGAAGGLVWAVNVAHAAVVPIEREGGNDGRSSFLLVPGSDGLVLTIGF